VLVLLALFTVEDAASTVLRKSGILLLLDATSSPSTRESSATPLRKPQNFRIVVGRLAGNLTCNPANKRPKCRLFGPNLMRYFGVVSLKAAQYCTTVSSKAGVP